MPEQSSNTLLTVLLVAGGILLLCVFLCVGGGILLFRGAVNEATTVAQNAVIRWDIESMSTALEMYRASHSEYPPNFGSPDAVDAHLRRAFPRYDPSAAGAAAPPAGLDAAEALVFWLQGFGPDPSNPLETGNRRSYFEFDRMRLRDDDGDGYPEYFPEDGLAPFVYFHHDAYGSAQFTPAVDVGGTARAYYSDESGEDFVNPEGFQILSSGRDNHYGQGGSYPSGEGYSDEDLDNVTNFAEMPLGDAMGSN